MPSYVRAGSLPPKRHIQFRRPDGGLYAEELFSTKGFESVYSLLYHLRPPTATLDVRPWKRPAVQLEPNELLRNRHFLTRRSNAKGDAVDARVPILGNADLVISVADVDRPMEYFYRNVGGDELLFVHDGSGTVETTFGDLAYRAHDYLLIPAGTTYRLRPAAATRLAPAPPWSFTSRADTSRSRRNFATNSDNSSSTPRTTSATSASRHCRIRATRPVNTRSASPMGGAMPSTRCKITPST